MNKKNRAVKPRAKTTTPKRGRPPKSDSEFRRQDIVNKAVGLFAEHGFDNTSFPMIAKAVGISQPAIVHHFRTKEDLFAECFQIVLQSNREVVESLHSMYDDGAKRLYKYVLGNVMWFTTQRRESNLLLLLYYYAQLRPYFSSLYSRLLEGAVIKISEILMAGLREKLFSFEPAEVRRLSTIFHNYALGACVNRSTTLNAGVYPHEDLASEMDVLCRELLGLTQRPRSLQGEMNSLSLKVLKQC